MTPDQQMPPPRIGISSCLLGENVRYDGTNKRNDFIIEQLSSQFEFVPFCPEVAIGMGIPRAPIQLVDCGGVIRARGVEDPSSDVTQPLQDYASAVRYELATLSAYIFKQNSPSCGVSKVKVLTANEYQLRGQGIFAHAIMQLFPALPVIDEQQLADSLIYEQFLQNVHNYYQSKL